VPQDHRVSASRGPGRHHRSTASTVRRDAWRSKYFPVRSR
jgi:hypothetical protein